MRRTAAIFLSAALAIMISSSIRPSSVQEISRARAIEIARGQVSFQPASVTAALTTSSRRPVWRVTLRGRLPGQPPLLFETVSVEVDRRNGDIVSIARP